MKLLSPLSDSTGRAINQYRLISLLGKGGMGEVWLAEDTRLRRNVALNPNSVPAMLGYGFFLTINGRRAEAVAKAA